MSLPLALNAATDIIPSTNRIDWANWSGVEGGIPYRTDIYTTLSATVSLAQLVAHLGNSSASNKVVLLETGFYAFSGTFEIPSYRTLRGSGSNTFITTADQWNVAESYSRRNINLHSGYTTGSSNIVLASVPTDLMVGNLIYISETNNTDYVDPYGNELETPAECTSCGGDDGSQRIRSHTCRVVSITDETNLAIFPPIYGPSFGAVRAPRISYGHPLDPPAVHNAKQWVGIENLSFSNGVVTHLRFEQAQNCWVSNVWFHSTVGSDAVLEGYHARNISVVHNQFLGKSSTSSALVTAAHTQNWTIENNYFDKFYQAWVFNGSGGGHVYAYNYSIATNSTTALIAEVSGHGGHEMFSLYEGNKWAKAHMDSIHGSSSSFNFFRNYSKVAYSFTTFGGGGIWIDSKNVIMSMVANASGYSGLSAIWGVESQTAIDGSSYVYRWGYSGNNPYEVDAASRSSGVFHANWDSVTNGVVYDAGITNRTYPASLYLLSKPGWFGDLQYPPIGPDATGIYTNEIPSEYRLRTGQDPASEVASATYGTSVVIGPGAKLIGGKLE
jgi:hypothetical protein